MHHFRFLVAMSMILLASLPLVGSQEKPGEIVAPNGVAAEVAGQAAAPANGRVRGEIANAQRLAVPGATLIATRRESSAVLGLTSSNERGFVSLDALPAGPYDVQVDAEGYLSSSLEDLAVRAPFRAIADLVLEEGYELGGELILPGEGTSGSVDLRVVDEKGKPLAGVRLRLDPVEERANPVEVHTDGAGLAQVDEVPAGTWRVTLFRAGLARLRVSRVVWRGGPLQIVAKMLPLPERAPVPLDELLPKPKLVE